MGQFNSLEKWSFHCDGATGETTVSMNFDHDGKFTLRHELESSKLQTNYARCIFRGIFSKTKDAQYHIVTDVAEYASYDGSSNYSLTTASL